MSLDKARGYSTLDKAYSTVDSETQTGPIAQPSAIIPKGEGHVVVVYNSTLGRHFLWTYLNSTWHGTEVF